MAEIVLTQTEADALIAMEKHRVDSKQWEFPVAGERLSIPLSSPDKREYFILDVTRVRVKVTKATYQNRARQAIILLRLDVEGGPHRNPDGAEITCPHLHIYREGYGDRWAIPAPLNVFSNTGNLVSTLDAFMRYCNITVPPDIQVGLFA